MPDLSPTIDGVGIKLGSTWANTVGDGTTAAGMNTTAAHDNTGINAIDLSAFGATQVERYYAEFDTSGVTSSPESATFKIYGKSNGAAGVICVQASFASAGALVTGDWDSWNESSPVTYTDGIDAGSWNTSGYNTFTLTAAALSAMVSLDEFQMICLEKDNDYDQSSAGSGLSIASGFYTQDDTSASRRPVLSYTEPAAPPAQQPIKILSGNMSILSGKAIIK